MIVFIVYYIVIYLYASQYGWIFWITSEVTVKDEIVQ